MKTANHQITALFQLISQEKLFSFTVDSFLSHQIEEHRRDLFQRGGCPATNKTDATKLLFPNDRLFLNSVRIRMTQICFTQNADLES